MRLLLHAGGERYPACGRRVALAATLVAPVRRGRRFLSREGGFQRSEAVTLKRGGVKRPASSCLPSTPKHESSVPHGGYSQTGEGPPHGIEYLGTVLNQGGISCCRYALATVKPSRFCSLPAFLCWLNPRRE